MSPLRFPSRIGSTFSFVLRRKNNPIRRQLMQELAEHRKSIAEHEDFIRKHPHDADNSVRQHLIKDVYGVWEAETLAKLRKFRRKK